MTSRTSLQGPFSILASLASLACLALLAPLAACLPEAGSLPTGGGGTSGGAGTGGTSSCVPVASGTTTTPNPNFATVREIVQLTCGGAGCHTGDTKPLLIDDANLYKTLTTYTSTFCGNRLLVKPCAPDESAFLLAQSGSCGATLPQMPLGCVDNCTPPAYLDGVRQWILNGTPQP